MSVLIEEIHPSNQNGKKKKFLSIKNHKSSNANWFHCYLYYKIIQNTSESFLKKTARRNINDNSLEIFPSKNQHLKREKFLELFKLK